MRDEHEREPEPRLDILQEIQDLRLHGDVERRGRLVRTMNSGAPAMARDGDALALAAGKFVREFSTVGGGEADERQAIRRRAPSHCRAARAAMAPR